MVTALVAGRPGPLQGDVVRAFRRAGFDVSDPAEIDLDLLDRRACQMVLERRRPDFVIDCSGAADSVLRASWQELDETLIGSEHLALAAVRAGAHSVYVSDVQVFGDRPGGERDESHLPLPTTPLGAATVRAEGTVARFNARHTIVRTQALYGPGWAARLEDVVSRARDTEALHVEPRPICAPTYAPHLADVLVSLVRSPCYGIVHRVGGGDCNEFELARVLVRVLAIPSRVEAVQDGAEPSPEPSTCLATRRNELAGMPHWRIGVRAWARERAPVGPQPARDG